MATNNTSSSNPWAEKMGDVLDALSFGIPLRLERRILPCLMGTAISMNTAHPPLMG